MAKVSVSDNSLIVGEGPRPLPIGEVAEWFKAQTWKVCVGATSPSVRIRLSPSPWFAKVVKIQWGTSSADVI